MIGKAISTLAALLAMGAGTPAEHGYAPHYAPHLMERVAARRGMEATACMVSSATHELGGWLWIYGERTGVLRLCHIVDVSDPKDIKRHRRTRRLIELSYEVTKDICGSTRERSIDCPVRVWVQEK